MDKQALVRSMKANVKDSSFINQTQLAKFMRQSREHAADIVRGLDYFPTKKEKKYFIPDVAERIMDQRLF